MRLALRAGLVAPGSLAEVGERDTSQVLKEVATQLRGSSAGAGRSSLGARSRRSRPARHRGRRPDGAAPRPVVELVLRRRGDPQAVPGGSSAPQRCMAFIALRSCSAVQRVRRHRERPVAESAQEVELEHPLAVGVVAAHERDPAPADEPVTGRELSGRAAALRGRRLRIRIDSTRLAVPACGRSGSAPPAALVLVGEVVVDRDRAVGMRRASCWRAERIGAVGIVEDREALGRLVPPSFQTIVAGAAVDLVDGVEVAEGQQEDGCRPARASSSAGCRTAGAAGRPGPTRSAGSGRARCGRASPTSRRAGRPGVTSWIWNPVTVASDEPPYALVSTCCF